MLYISVLVLDMKMGERVGLETTFTTEPIFNTERPGWCYIWDQTEENLSKPSAVYSFNFQQVANGVIAMSVENICELVFAHRGESFKFILDCALSEEAPYFLWTKCADMTFDWPNERIEWKEHW